MIKHPLIDHLPLTGDMVSLWVPSGTGRAIDLIRGNHGQCNGTHPNVPTIAPPIVQIAHCDTLADWAGNVGEVLSIDGVDFKEGVGSLKDSIAAPIIGNWYQPKYVPGGTWDWSKKKDLLLWLICDRPNTAFTAADVKIYDSSGNARSWGITFLAGEWTGVKKPLHSDWNWQSPAPPNLALINRIELAFRAADEVAFYMKIDDWRVTGYPSIINPSVGWVFGGDDYIEVPDDNSLNVTDKFTIGMGMNPSNPTFTRDVFSKSTSGGDYEPFRVFLPDASTTQIQLADAIDNRDFSVLAHGIPLDLWTFLTVTFNSGAVRFYFNGVLMGSDVNAITSLYASTDNLFIGTRNAASADFGGYIALPFLANKAWSQQQVNNFYLATKSFFAPRG